MKHYLNIRNDDVNRFIYDSDGQVEDVITYRGGGHWHKTVIYRLIKDLYDIEDCREHIEKYNIKNIVFKFNGFEIKTEIIVKQILFEIIDYSLVGRRDYFNTTMEEIREYIDDLFDF